MNTLARVIRVECYKLRRTLVLAASLLTPLVANGMMLAALLDDPQRFQPGTEACSILQQNMITMWAVFLLPLLLALQATLLAQVEHSGEKWKYLYALPIPRPAFFAAKWAALATLQMISEIVYFLGFTGVFWIMRLLAPGLNYENALNMGWLVGQVGMLFLSALLAASIQLWCSLIWKSVIPSLALGVAVSIIGWGLATVSSPAALIFPWTLPVMVVSGTASQISLALWMGAAGGPVAAVPLAWLFSRRDVL